MIFKTSFTKRAPGLRLRCPLHRARTSFHAVWPEHAVGKRNCRLAAHNRNWHGGRVTALLPCFSPHSNPCRNTFQVLFLNVTRAECSVSCTRILFSPRLRDKLARSNDDAEATA